MKIIGIKNYFIQEREREREKEKESEREREREKTEATSRIFGGRMSFPKVFPQKYFLNRR